MSISTSNASARHSGSYLQRAARLRAYDILGGSRRVGARGRDEEDGHGRPYKYRSHRQACHPERIFDICGSAEQRAPVLI